MNFIINKTIIGFINKLLISQLVIKEVFLLYDTYHCF